MKSKSDFWLTLHQLAEDLSLEGSNTEERAHNVCEVLKTLSPSTRSVYLSNLTLAVEALSEVAVHCKDGG